MGDTVSRTDATRPYWVRVRDNSERRIAHHMHERRGWRPYRGMSAITSECDLDEHDSRPFHERYFGSCSYSLVHERPFSSCPAWYRAVSWQKPERIRERDDLRAMAREYNTYGDLEEDGDFACPQHRHRSSQWWW